MKAHRVTGPRTEHVQHARPRGERAGTCRGDADMWVATRARGWRWSADLTHFPVTRITGAYTGQWANTAAPGTPVTPDRNYHIMCVTRFRGNLKYAYIKQCLCLPIRLCYFTTYYERSAVILLFYL